MISKKIDRNLARYRDEESKIVKVLLLGPGECGKSTILKQLKFLHNEGMIWAAFHFSVGYAKFLTQ